MKKILLLFGLVLCFMGVLSVNTFAYLDPSAMTYMYQAILGVVIASGAVIAIFWKRIRLYFKKKKQAKRFKEMDNSDTSDDPKNQA